MEVPVTKLKTIYVIQGPEDRQMSVAVYDYDPPILQINTSRKPEGKEPVEYSMTLSTMTAGMLMAVLSQVEVDNDNCLISAVELDDEGAIRYGKYTLEEAIAAGMVLIPGTKPSDAEQ